MNVVVLFPLERGFVDGVGRADDARELLRLADDRHRRGGDVDVVVFFGFGGVFGGRRVFGVRVDRRGRIVGVVVGFGIEVREVDIHGVLVVRGWFSCLHHRGGSERQHGRQQAPPVWEAGVTDEEWSASRKRHEKRRRCYQRSRGERRRKPCGFAERRRTPHAISHVSETGSRSAGLP